MQEKKDTQVRPDYEEIGHPSDIGLRFRGRKIEELFENAGLGMFSIMTDIGKAGSSSVIRLTLFENSRNPEDILIQWLEKLLYYFEVKNIIFSRIDVDRLVIGKKGICLNAVLYGEKVDKKRHIMIKAIKAPTYHLLSIVENEKDGSWEGTVIFDV